MRDGKKEMLRKKTHVVRKKTHVVRKFFYVASIFGGVARRRNRPPWELSSTEGDFLPRHPVGGNAFNALTEHPSFIGAPIQVYRTPIFLYKIIDSSTHCQGNIPPEYTKVGLKSK